MKTFNKQKKYKSENIKIKTKLKKKIVNTKNFFKIPIKNLGYVNIPKYDFKTVEIADLLKINEQLAIDYYYKNRKIYKRVADIGANIGLHTAILSKIGYEVTSFEPDPIHFKFLKKCCEINKIRPKLIKKAVYVRKASMSFIRVEDHSLKSHLKIASKNINSYGAKKKFKVNTLNFKKILKDFDFIKIDVEGSEAYLLKSLRSAKDFKCNMMVEISNKNNAKIIYKHLKKLNLNFINLSNFKNKKIKSLNDMPSTYMDGFLIIKKFN